MIFRSLFSGILAAGVLISGHVSAQVLLCPAPPELSASDAETQAETAEMLERLLIAFDLYGHEGIDIDGIISAHAEMPEALLTKLGNVADRCALADTGDLNAFYEKLPDLRRIFLEAALIGSIADEKGHHQSGANADLRGNPAFVDLIEAVQSEPFIDLSVRALWRNLWFRSPDIDTDHDDRWAVIVASPADDNDGWKMLGEFQKAWEDVYFQLHQPYYDDSSYHAIVVGKKLPREDAERLLAYVKELGMADDSYLWPVPIDETVDAVISTNTAEDIRTGGKQVGLDLSILNK